MIWKTKYKHLDMGKRGSEYTVFHNGLRNRSAFFLTFILLTTFSFSLGLHLLEFNILALLSLALFALVVLKLYWKIYSESVLILPSLGIQVETKYYLGAATRDFIDSVYIKDIVINEAVTMHSILAYLVVLLKDKRSDQVDRLYPLYPHSCPPVSFLQQVYRAAQFKLISQKNR